jgi:hypothetical protein
MIIILPSRLPVHGADIMQQNPYNCKVKFAWLDRVIQLMLSGDSEVFKLFSEYNPSQGVPHLNRVCVQAYRLQYAPLKSNEWFLRAYAGVYIDFQEKVDKDIVWKLPDNEELENDVWRRILCG